MSKIIAPNVASVAVTEATISPSFAGSTAGHTPGPWTVEEAWGAEPGDPLSLCFHEIRANGETIASTWASPHLANARLMAAAPELLLIVQQSAKTFRLYEALHREKGTPDGERKADKNAAVAAVCEAAIARVEGRS